MKQICIIIPVLNEEKNIFNIYKKIKKTKIPTDILFIEDNSLDKTREHIINLSKKDKNIKYIFRKNKSGIGSAHKDAIKWCYKKKYKTIISMDADGTHNPRYLKKLIFNSKNSDMVITSRFKNLKSLADWPIHRRLLTYIRYWITKLILSIDYDSSGAYRCFARKRIKLNDLTKTNSNTYDYFFESIYILHKKNYKIKEISINLPYRKLGKSKMTFLHILKSLITILQLRYKNY